ncbi:MAG: metallophosphoesterase family protein [Planctomycetaceae bacterium]|nr:metallophosphoesterase family protein [Planctomycetaceae bacterium]
MLLHVIRTLVPVGLLFGSFSISSAWAHDDHTHEASPVPEEHVHAPSAMPDRILLTWMADPAHTQAITWRTDQTVTRAYAEVAPAEAGPLFVAHATRFEATSTSHVSDLGPALYHEVNLTGLTPETLYVYRVGDGANWSAWIHFRTASEEHKPFTFVYFGDAQNDVKSHWSRVFREAFSDAPRASFMLHAGDLVNRGNRDAEWGEWCSAGGWVNAMIPTIAIPGNHEYDITRTGQLPESPEDQKQMPRSLATRWQARFAYPDNGPTEFSQHLRETAYFLDYQGMRLIGLNSMEDFDVQARWLREVLSDNPNRWTIVTHHHPVFSVSKGRDNPELRDAWQPVYDEFKVDLVLQGHDHSYGRTGFRKHSPNVTGGTTFRDSDSGTLYVVSVSGPKQYDAGEGHFVRRAEDTQLYQIITVDGDQLEYQAKTATGGLYDAFTLVKRSGQPNELIERAPNSPEIRRVRNAGN